MTARYLAFSLFTFASSLLGLPVGGAEEPGKIVMASDFAKGLDGWKVENFQDKLTIMTAQETDDLVIRNDKSKEAENVDTSFSIVSPQFAVVPGTELAVVVEARGNVSMHAPRNRFGSATGVYWYGADRKPMLIQNTLGKMVPAASEFGFKSFGTRWNRSVRFATVPEGAAFASIGIGGDAPDIRRGMHVEIRKLEVRAREAGKGWDFGDLEAPKYALISDTPNPDPNATIRFRVTDDSRLERSSFVCKLDGRDVFTNLTYEGKGVFAYRPATPWEKDSLHLISLEACDVCGNSSSEKLAFFCGERKKSGLVTLRDDGMTLIDGKPFFPIGPFSMRKCPPNEYDFVKGLKELKSGGCNMVHSYLWYQTGKKRDAKTQADYVELVEACEKAGMKLVVEAAGRDYGDPNRPEQLREVLLHARPYGCFLAWCIGDDTSAFRTGLDLKNDDNIIKAVDNARLTTQADGTTFRGRFLPYVNSTDTLMNELYTYKSEKPEPEALAMFVRNLKISFADKQEAGGTSRAIWPLVQAFSGWGAWKRFPTTAEIRAQSYLGIIYGGRGMTYYTYYSFSKGANGAAHKPEQLASLLSVTRELAFLHDDLTSRDAKAQPKVTVLEGRAKDLLGNDAVACLLKDGAEGKGRLLMAASSSNERTKAKIEMGEKGERVDTLFENGRKVAVENGCIVDTFEPGAVHVYRIRHCFGDGIL